MLYVGGGIVNAGAEAELMALAEETKIPVVTTLLAKGAFPDSHQLSLQMPGMHGSKFANWALHRSDLLITVGARFDDRVTGKLDAFAPGAKVIHMDIDPAEISKNRTADIPIVGELREVLPQLTKAIAKLRESDSIMNHRAWLEQVEEWKFKYPYRYRRAGALKPEYVIERLRDLLADRDTIWTTGVGQHQMFAAQWLRIDEHPPLHHLRRPRHDGLRLPRRARRQDRPARGDGRLHRRRRLLPDDGAGARDGRRLRHPGHRRRDEQRLARDGAPVAGAVPRRALLADAPERRRSPTT